LRLQLASSDYFEVINFSFVDARWELDFAGATDPIRLVIFYVSDPDTPFLDLVH